MKWAGRLLPAASRKLQDCCDAAGVVLADAHCALADARATAGLVKQLMEYAGVPPPWASELSGADEFPWPDVTGSEVPLLERGTAPPRRPAGWLDRIVARMPRHEDIRVESYLKVSSPPSSISTCLATRRTHLSRWLRISASHASRFTRSIANTCDQWRRLRSLMGWSRVMSVPTCSSGATLRIDSQPR